MAKTFETEEGKEREKMDLDTINALKKAGSDLSKPHNLEHHFVVENLQIAMDISNVLKNDGYEISDTIEGKNDNGNVYYYFDIVKPFIMKPEHVFKESEKMAVIAKKYGILYDGWGTTVVR